MRDLLHDFRAALRSFRSGRAALLLAALVLAAAIGAGTTTFSVVSGVLLRSLPYERPEELVNFRVTPLARRVGAGEGATLSEQSAALIRAGTDVLEISARIRGAGDGVLSSPAGPRRITGWAVSPEFFPALGAPALLGRTLTAADRPEGGAAPVVVSHRFWLSHFGRAPDVIGRSLAVDGEGLRVVGVMPVGFDFPAGTDFWRVEEEPAPAVARPDQVQGGYWLIGRLRDGVTVPQAVARLDARFQAHALEHPGFARWGPGILPLREHLLGPVRRPLLLALAAVALVILAACANVAAVLLARGIHRRRELAIRLSIGASRLRVVRLLLTESVLLALGGGAGGILIAVWAVPALVGLLGEQIPRAAEIAVDWRVVAAAVAASTLTGVCAGLVPALMALREDPANALKGAAPAPGARTWRTRASEGLVVLQVASGTVLLTGAALLVATFVNLVRVDVGFDAERVLMAHTVLPDERYDSAARREAFTAALLERALAVPGVRAAAIGAGVPFQPGAIGTVGIVGAETPPGARWAWMTGATPEYFRVLGIPLLRGGGLAGDGAVVVNEAFARDYFPGQDPLGRAITYFGDQEGTIVGVVGDTRQQSLRDEPGPAIYGTLGAMGGGYLSLVVRADGPPAVVQREIAEAVHSVDPLLPIDRLGPVNELVEASVQRERLYAVTLSAFAVVALLITALGLYGATAYALSRRVREIGIRVALGASAARVRGATIGRTAAIAATGVALGLAGAWNGARFLESTLFGLSPADPRVYLGVALLLGLVAVAAALPLARRASRISPMIALRAD